MPYPEKIRETLPGKGYYPESFTGYYPVSFISFVSFRGVKERGYYPYTPEGGSSSYPEKIREALREASPFEKLFVSRKNKRYEKLLVSRKDKRYEKLFEGILPCTRLSEAFTVKRKGKTTPNLLPDTTPYLLSFRGVIPFRILPRIFYLLSFIFSGGNPFPDTTPYFLSFRGIGLLYTGRKGVSCFFKKLTHCKPDKTFSGLNKKKGGSIRIFGKRFSNLIVNPICFARYRI